MIKKISPNALAAMRAQAYPEILDDDGRPAWVALLEERDTVIAALRAEVSILRALAENTQPTPESDKNSDGV